MLKKVTTFLRYSIYKRDGMPTNPEDKQQYLKAINLGSLAAKILEENRDKPKLLPPKLDNKLTVVFEMDDVLAYTFTPDEEGYLLAPRRKYDHHLWFQEYEALLSIYKRKNLDNFLNYLSEECQPVIFSAGVQSYVQLVMSLIDPSKKIKHIITQEHCNRITSKEDQIDEYVKDLNLLGRDLKRVVYFDSKFLAFWLQPENAFPASEFKADDTMEGEDLDGLLLSVEELRNLDDVRPYLMEKYKLKELLKEIKLL